MTDLRRLPSGAVFDMHDGQWVSVDEGDFASDADKDAVRTWRDSLPPLVAEPAAFDHAAWVRSLKPGVQLLQKSRGSWRTATVIPNPDWDKGNDEHVWTRAEGEADGYWQRDNTDDEEIRPLPTPSEADALRAELAEAKRLRDEALRSFRAREDAIEKAEKRAGTTEMERDALRARLAEVERECIDARASLAHVNKALGYPVDVNKWDDAEAAGLMLVEAIRKSREYRDAAVDELRRVTLDRDAKADRASKAEAALDAMTKRAEIAERARGEAVKRAEKVGTLGSGKALARMLDAMDIRPASHWTEDADAVIAAITKLRDERDAYRAQVTSKSCAIGEYTTTMQALSEALGLGANPHVSEGDLLEAISKLRDEAKVARKPCPVDVSTLRLLRASGLFGNEINTLAGWALEEEARR